MRTPRNPWTPAERAAIDAEAERIRQQLKDREQPPIPDDIIEAAIILRMVADDVKRSAQAVGLDVSYSWEGEQGHPYWLLNGQEAEIEAQAAKPLSMAAIQLLEKHGLNHGG